MVIYIYIYAARKFHNVRKGTKLHEHVFELIGTRHQLADILKNQEMLRIFHHGGQLSNININSSDSFIHKKRSSIGVLFYSNKSYNFIFFKRYNMTNNNVGNMLQWMK